MFGIQSLLGWIRIKIIHFIHDLFVKMIAEFFNIITIMNLINR